MNTSKLAKQLKKELTRNPKKTAALGLVTLVALWFWAPLAYKWIGGDPKKKARRAAAVAAAEEAGSAPVVDPAAATPVVVPKITWDLLLDRIAKDSLMATATLPNNARDPFAITSAEQQVVAAAPAVAPGAPPVVQPMTIDPTPEASGLKLEATFVSRQTRRAMINGKTYRLGDRVKVLTATEEPETNAEAEDGTLGLEFQVTEIETHRVVLVRNDKEFPLILKRESLDGDEQLTFGPSSQVSTQQ